MLGQAIGVGGCRVIGMLADLGIPCACGSDVLGAVSAVMLRRDAGRNPSSLRDIVRNANGDNTEAVLALRTVPRVAGTSGQQARHRRGGQGQLSCATAM